ncbi:MAG: transglycosylase SLT domain-containing protein [Myxococcales bacterium]|nr:transglycosylase SLT domain-containing protein [Myxococcales bacterium]
MRFMKGYKAPFGKLVCYTMLLMAVVMAAIKCTATGGVPNYPGYRSIAAGPIETGGTSSSRCFEVAPVVHATAELHELEPALLLGIIRVESNFDASARSRAGALGLMQVMPATAKHNRCGNLLHPHDNVVCGARVLTQLLKRYDGNLVYALSAYHAGSSLANKARSESRLPSNFGYVEKVLMARNWYLRYGCQ